MNTMLAFTFLALLAVPVLWVLLERSQHPYYLTRKFHRAFNHPIAPEPVIPDAKTRLLRVRLLVEEVSEFARASGYPIKVLLDWERHSSMLLMDAVPELSRDELINIVEAADAIADINVVANGAALVWGFPQPHIDRAVFESNMSKLGADGKPIYDEHGKIQKGPNYAPPTERILQILRDAKSLRARGEG